MKFWDRILLVAVVSLIALAFDDLIIVYLWNTTDTGRPGHASSNHLGVVTALAITSLAATAIVAIKSKHLLLALATLLLTCGGSFALGHYVLHKW